MSGGAFLANGYLPTAFLTDAATIIVPSPVDVSYLSPRPRFQYGTNGDVTLDLPSTAFDYALSPIGGDIEADSGMRASFVVRRDNLYTFTLRFREHLWSAVQAFIDFAQTGVPFRWYPDAADLSRSFIVQLIAPAVGTKYEAIPHPEYPLVQLLTITIVRGSSAPAVVIPPPPTIDRTAIPWAFYQRDKGYWQDGAKAVAAIHLDPVQVWEDQWIHHRDATATIPGYGSGGNLRARREHNEIYFGVSDEAPGPGSGRSVLGFPSMVFLNELTVMLSLRATFSPPPVNSRSNAFTFNASGTGSDISMYPDTDGNVRITFGESTHRDIGNLGGLDLTRRVILTISGSNFTRQLNVYANNILVYQRNLIGSEGFSWAGFNNIGWGNFGNTIDLGWDGRYRDVLLVDGLMSSSQMLAWFNYMRGVVSTPPLPLLP